MSSTSSGVSAGLVGQLTAGVGATLALLSPIWFPLAGAGMLLLVLGVIVSAPSARDRGPYMEQWWNAIAFASLVCLAGFGLGLIVPVVGRVLLTVGGVLVLIVVALASPPEGGRAGARG